jgi:kynureninase
MLYRKIFEEAGIERLAAKQYLLTGYLEHLMDVINDTSGVENLINIITPRDPQQRGTQLSIIFSIPLKNVHEQLEKRGVVVMLLRTINP